MSPVKAVAYIKANKLAGPMLNDYTFGGYLIWAAPQYPVMMDGRTDLYEWSGFLGEYRNWATMQSDPNLLLDKYNQFLPSVFTVADGQRSPTLASMEDCLF